MPDQFIIRLKQINKSYHSEQAGGVAEIDLNVEKGKILAIVGESGSGKSSLLKLIYGLISPDTGNVFFNDDEVLGPEKKLIPGHDRMKMVTQDFSLNLFAKVYDNIAGMLSNTDLKAKRQKTLEAMDFLNISHLSEKRATDLSGGEQQRVAIARAIISDPEVLLLDEPFSQVDALLKNQLRADVKRLAVQLGITVILVSHDPADGLSLADHLIVLKEGRIIEYGTPMGLYANPKNLHTAKLLANCNVLTAEDALMVGIAAKGEVVVIYPEWVQIKKGRHSKLFHVKDSFFKGFYRELLLESGQCKLRAIDYNSGYVKGDRVQVIIKKYLEF